GPAPSRRNVSPITPADSVRIVRQARSAQTAFEAFRRRELPLRNDGGGDVCDVRIGRYCYWRGDENDESDDPPEESLIVRARREALIEQLDTATSKLAGDAWLAGQEVRYLVEAGKIDDALRAADRCRAAAGWCRMLAGYAAHSGGRFVEADSLFRAGLREMEPAERCRWLDISDLLDGDLADRFKATSCDDRPAFVRRLLRL